METKNRTTKNSIIAGFFVCILFPILIFSRSPFCALLKLIADFGLYVNVYFWGITFPLFIILLFWNSSKKITPPLNNTEKYQTCYQFSFEVSSKIIIALFSIYIIGLLVNGISSTVGSQFFYTILFSLTMIIVTAILLTTLTIISSLLIINPNKTSQNSN